MKTTEKWDLFDENRQPLGKQCVRGGDIALGEYHTVVGIWVVNSKNEILLTLRDPNKDDYPNLWENTGGSVLAGETSRQGASRELFEETGIKIPEGALAYLGTNKGQTAFVDLYAVRKDIEISDLVMQEGETVGAQWVTPEKLSLMAANGEIADPVVQRLELMKNEFANFLYSHE